MTHHTGARVGCQHALQASVGHLGAIGYTDHTGVLGVTDTNATTTYIFTFKIKKGKNKRFYVRVFDLCDNESDTIGRRVFRPRVQRREPATTTDPEPGDGVTPVVATAQSVGTPGFITASSPSLTNIQAAATANREDFGPDEEIPTAKPTSRSSTIVVSPYFPRIELDVSGFSSGDIATDPRNGLPFLIP
jgi:hypothetical protein